MWVTGDGVNCEVLRIKNIQFSAHYALPCTKKSNNKTNFETVILVLEYMEYMDSKTKGLSYECNLKIPEQDWTTDEENSCLLTEAGANINGGKRYRPRDNITEE